MRLVRSCLARIGCLTVIVLVAAGAWVWRDSLRDWWRYHTHPTSVEAPSRELARESSHKLDDFLRGRGPARVTFDEAELQSLLDYRYRDSLPAGLSDARITLGDSTLEASAALEVERLTNGRAPEALRSLLGDSARTSAELEPAVRRPGFLSLRVRRLTAGGLPIPSMMVPWLLEQTGLTSDADRSVSLRMPDDVTDVRVVEGRLRLERSRPK
jgi:hypothetical protein